MKKLFTILTALFLTIFFTGCIHNLDKNGLTLSITEKELSESFDEALPYKKNFVFGDLSIDNPKVKLANKSNRVNAGIDFGLKTLFTSALQGKFQISGEPIYNKEKGAIFLQNVKLENFAFNQLKISDDFSQTFNSALEPMINEVLKLYPIYTVPKDSIHGSFVKDIKVEDSKLLVTYGI